MTTKIRFVDVLKSFDVPGIVPLEYTDHNGLPMLAKVKAGATALYCPQCGGMTPVLNATARGLCCKVCTMRQRATVEADELQAGIDG